MASRYLQEGIIMTVLYSILAFMTLSLPSVLQEEKVYTVSEVSVKPEPVRGLKDFHERWSKKVKYPEDALKAKVQGMVYIEFVVNADSSVSEATVKSGIGYGCDEAALKEFIQLSKEGWKPGIKNNEPVKVKMVLPFFYRIIVQE